MKKFTRFLGLLAVVVGLGFSLSSCSDMNKTGYQIEYYPITYDTTMDLQDQLSTSTPEQLRNYIKIVIKAEQHNYWCSSENDIRDFLKKTLKGFYNTDAIINNINSHSSSCFFASYRDGESCFFYIKNNEF